MKKSLFGILLSLALMLGMLPALGMSQTAYATDSMVGTVIKPNGSYEERVDLGDAYYKFTPARTSQASGKYQSVDMIWSEGNWTLKLVGSSGAEEVVVSGSEFPVPDGVWISGGNGSQSDPYTFELYYIYPLSVGGVQVTSANMSGNGWSYTPKTDTSAAVLKLNGYDNEGAVCEEGAGIYAEEDLIIETAGTNTVSNQTTSGSAIEVKGDLTFKGTGTVNASGGTFGVYAHKSDESGDITINGGVVSVTSTTTGLQSHGDITINGGEVSAVSERTGISAGKDIIINKGNVTATSTGSGECGITANNGVTINGGTVEAIGDVGISAIKAPVKIKAGSVKAACTKIGIGGLAGVTIDGGTVEAAATGDESYGIFAREENVEVTINGGNVTASGTAKAISSTVKNSVRGTGWTDAGGTEGKEAIDADTSGRTLTYKKVQFPAEEPVVTQYTITYDLSGGTLDGQTGTVTKKVDAGTVITLPAPIRDGYTFDYWEGSRYNAGDKYTVTGDHTFTAVWKTGAGGDGKKGSGTKTGDEQNIAGWITIMLASVSALAAIAVRRKDILHR